mmetsp:Transcript_10365/g.27438  ORF Transcript_10365/g.27438 Transcript_10365/m.27438 type:complete len:88 (+) Transcript_10365:272-535(+)
MPLATAASTAHGQDWRPQHNCTLSVTAQASSFVRSASRGAQLWKCSDGIAMFFSRPCRLNTSQDCLEGSPRRPSIVAVLGSLSRSDS